jgi:hypothetical protein
LEAARLADEGQYTAVIRNAVGQATSNGAQLTVVPAKDAGRITNLSVLTSIDQNNPADASFSVGFSVAGADPTASMPLLLRAGGPSLARFGVSNAMPDPRLELYAGTTRVSENDDWGGSGALAEAMRSVGAFPFIATDTKDAALFAGRSTGSATVRISGVGSGAVIAEIYDATGNETVTAATPRLVNISVLKTLTPGTSLGAGFVIAGRSPQTVLVRAIGPGLAPFGVASPTPNLRLDVFRNGNTSPAASNEKWAGESALKAAFAAVGAFGLVDTSNDAALVLTLEPGSYTAQVTGGARGMALVEVYAVP